MGEEAWFEDRYPNLLNNAKAWFIEVINFWVSGNWGSSQFKELSNGIPIRKNVYARGSLRNDNEFEKQGDKPQSRGFLSEADTVLGSFSIDVETPIKINYSKVTESGRSIDLATWRTVMYVEDVLGLQKGDNVFTEFTGWLFPSRRARRANWTIQAEEMSYVVKSGDTLSKIASDIYGQANQWKRIHDANLIPDPNQILPGQRLRIPKP